MNYRLLPVGCAIMLALGCQMTRADTDIDHDIYCEFLKELDGPFKAAAISNGKPKPSKPKVLSQTVDADGIVTTEFETFGGGGGGRVGGMANGSSQGKADRLADAECSKQSMGAPCKIIATSASCAARSQK